jgi:hypothetical protein
MVKLESIQWKLTLSLKLPFPDTSDELGVCPGPKMCGPPPCHGPKPKPEHWHCPVPAASTSADNTTYVESYYVSESTSGASQVASSSSNFWLYVLAGAALTTMIVGVAFRKKVRVLVEFR